MRLRPAVVAVLLAWALGAAAQQAPSANPTPVLPCKDHTVDEYLAVMHKRHRNKNPLPDNACILGWCRQPGAPGDDPVSHPPQAPLPPPTQAPATPPGESSSRASQAGSSAERGTALYDPVAGAKNAEAGDYYFGQKNYRAALSRYQEALEDKPDDAAIHLRLARTWEKLDDPAKAYEHFDAALILSPDGPEAKAAGEGLERLRPQLEKAGIDTARMHERNAAAISATCPAAKP